MKLVIDRAKWCRGGENTSLIRSEDGCMCCLGFFGLACGVPGKLMIDKAGPASAKHSGWPEWLNDGETMLTAKHLLLEANDESSINDSEREQRITEIFAKHGVEVEFK